MHPIPLVAGSDPAEARIEPQTPRLPVAPLAPVFDDTVRLARSLFHVATSVVSLVDTERRWFEAQTDADVSASDRMARFCAKAITDDPVLTILDASQDERFAGDPLVTGSPHIRFYAGAPLVTAAGATIGTLCIFDPVARTAFDADERRHLAMLARIVVDRLEVRRLMIQQEERAVLVRQVGVTLDKAAQTLDRKAHTLSDLAHSGIRQSEAAVDNMTALVDLSAEMQQNMSVIVDDIERSTESAKGTCEAVHGLDAHLDGIASVAGMIDAIAVQSRLLALNASIEAARAGEAGRGFAVVAHEVKQMASRTAEATHQIGIELGSIRETVGDVLRRCADLSATMEQMRCHSVSVADAAARKAFVRAEVGGEVGVLVEVSRNVGLHARDVTAASILLLEEAEILRTRLEDTPLSVGADRRRDLH